MKALLHTTSLANAGQIRRKGIAILGSTGSIGINTLNVVALHPELYKVVVLTGNQQVDRLFEQCQRFLPEIAVMLESQAASELRIKIKAAGLPIEVLSGIEGLRNVAQRQNVDIVMAAIVGAAGLLPTLDAVRAGKRVLLANKEALVMSGHLFMEEVRRTGAELLPIDSEHNAIFQCIPQGGELDLDKSGVRKILLTCSGGPFRNASDGELERVTPEQACAHPNWAMGRKISVDSATLMNKGLELIEACWLFNTIPDRIEVIIHPQSIIHSMVEYVDGSILAQLGNPDMRTPIAHALAWPERIKSGVSGLDLIEMGRLDFMRPDFARFPCLGLAYEVARVGGTAPAILNAANEVAVQAFLDRYVSFLSIPRIIEDTLAAIPATFDVTLDAVMAEDARARAYALKVIAQLGKTGMRSVQ